jgi:hypothetical protein
VYKGEWSIRTVGPADSVNREDWTDSDSHSQETWCWDADNDRVISKFTATEYFGAVKVTVTKKTED